MLSLRNRFPLAAAIAALAAWSTLIGACVPSQAAIEQTAGAPATEQESRIDMAADWREIDELVSEQKYRAALERVESLLAEPSLAERPADRVRALVAAAQLHTGLGGFETAVDWLRRQEPPAGGLERAIVDLYYAHGLLRYLDAYSWEIRQRERVAGPEDLAESPLTVWTADQIAGEAWRVLERVWSAREEWGVEPLGALGAYIEQNDYPARIRGTLRDAITYVWAESLADSSLWTAEQSNRLFRLDLDRLIEGRTPKPPGHPLERMAGVLGDLERWHAASGRSEAAFEARRQRLLAVRGHLDGDTDRQAIRKALEAALDDLGRRYPWWSMGQAELAQWVRSEDAPDALVRARTLARDGRAAHPESVGGRRCAHLVAAIEMPEFSIAGMASDGPRRRSIQVMHRNLGELSFRAFALDLEAEIEARDERRLLGDTRRAERLLASAEPDAEWRVELPATTDFRSHRTYVTPPIDRPGLYLVVASADRAFRPQANQLAALEFVVGDLVLVSRAAEGRAEVTVRSGASGRALAGAEVSLYQYDYRRGHRRLARRTTGDTGTVEFEIAPRQAHFLVARRGDELALDPSFRTRFARRAEPPRSATLIYTDRSIYRPEQSMLWKVVAYEREGGGRFHTLPETRLTVRLHDPNGEVAAETEVETNAFGTASGAFQVPAGRLLGGWSVATSLGGSTQVRVEEYKRPTFEVEVAESEQALRLNRPARLRGSARYYFGLPVVEGEVVWRVHREPVYPRWWFMPTRGRAETVASGVARLGADGEFAIEITPEADEREADDRRLSYRYRLEVEVTDAGGETRSATRTFRLGFVAVEAVLTGERAFETAGSGARWTVRRVDLDGVPRAGRGAWRLLALEQPEETPLPADLPLPAAREGELETPGDRLRPRWAGDYEPARLLRSWADGREIERGDTDHGDDGEAAIDLPPLAPGAYRLRYTTRDPFGAEYQTAEELLVVEAGTRNLRLPALALAERRSVGVGDRARLLVHSGLPDQQMVLEIFRRGERLSIERLRSSAGAMVIEIPIEPRHRGGFGYTLTALRDHQLMVLSGNVFVPWDDRRLAVEFETFRDRLRPGSGESWTVRLRSADSETLAAGSAELLAYMYDRSLDLFAPHRPADPLGLYPVTAGALTPSTSLGQASYAWLRADGFPRPPAYPGLREDRLVFLESYGIGGMGSRRFLARAGGPPMPSALRVEEAVADAEVEASQVTESRVLDDAGLGGEGEGPAEPPGPPPAELRTDFSETAFWEPHLRLGDDGTATFEFTVPDSLTEWSVWVHALTRDLRAGSLERRTRTVKELLVRPYLPRFLREGDELMLPVVVNNAGEKELAGRLRVELFDPADDTDLAAAFGLAPEAAEGLPFRVEPGGGTELAVRLRAPSGPGAVGIRVTAAAGGFTDGEQRQLPVLPGRLHLAQSRFAALEGAQARRLVFDDLVADDDASRIDEGLVVTVDAQPFYGVLRALPYLASYPYECIEQLLNRFLSTGIVSSLFDGYPAVAAMAREFASRETPLEAWDQADPNRRMALEETPWLASARGGEAPGAELIPVLDPRIARATREAALAKLIDAQTSSGGFPWWPGGPPSPYMTAYLLQGFSRALEFGVEVPKEPVVKAWAYLHRHYLDVLVREAIGKDCCWEMVTFVNYVLSSYPDESWSAGVWSRADRQRMLEFSFGHWRRHSPLSKAHLALTLERSGRSEDARRVFDSVMDSARTEPDLGTFWAPEARAWLWYNDTIESHAFALRTLTELAPDDPRRGGLVHWLFLNKKLNQWKSTRATAEVLYALVHYLEREGSLGAREEITVEVGGERRRFAFEPDRYGPSTPHGERLAGEVESGEGRPNQFVIPGESIRPAEMSAVKVEKSTPGLAFASATWRFSTERLPERAEGDFLAVERRYFRRFHDGREWVLEPLAAGEAVAVGDQVEVHLWLRTRHAAEYVHLRDPRAAGFEPETLTSRYQWDLGIGWYEEVRDSGANFFLESLPVGEYTFKYRLRAATAGSFRVGPATLQSMYAPEFNAYSAGARLRVDAD